MEYCENNLDVFIVLDDFNTQSKNVRVMELGAKRPSSLKYDKSEAYGQDGYTKVSEDAYKGFERTSRLLINNIYVYDEFMHKFYQGKDVKVYYSDDGYKFRYGTISDLEDVVIIGENREITLTIDLQPFKYGKPATIDITKKKTIYNVGNVYTMPILKVYGNGRGRIYIDEQVIDLDVNQFLIVDNVRQDIFDKDGLRANSRRKSGDFPMRIRKGENIISFDGAITKIEMELNWRWR